MFIIFSLNSPFGVNRKLAAVAIAVSLAALLYPLQSESQTENVLERDVLSEDEVESDGADSGQEGAAQYKFDEGFYDLLHGGGGTDLRQARGQEAGDLRKAPREYHDVVIIVSRGGSDGIESDEAASRNKATVVRVLKAMGARDIVPAQSLSFVTASVPIHRIGELSLLDEVLQLGDGEALATLPIDTARTTVRATSELLSGVHAGGLNGSGVVVAVVDTGISSPYLNDRVTKRSWCEDCEFRNGLIYGNTTVGVSNLNQTSASHGTRVAQVIAASGLSANNGIAPGVSLLDALAGGDGATDYSIAISRLVHAVDWAVNNGADVANISLGYSFCQFRVTSLYLIVTEAVNRGMVVLSSASNDGAFGTINYPACVENGVAVGGIDDRSTPNIRLYPGTSRGPSTQTEPRLLPHIVAPAVDIQGLRYSTDSQASQTGRGTSFSTPVASAGAALLLQAKSDMEPMETRSAMLLGARWTGPVPCTSTQYEKEDPDDDCSHARQPGRLDPDRNSLSILNNVGFGILDVAQSAGYVANFSSHFVSESLDANTEARRHAINVTGSPDMVKIILTWPDKPEMTSPGFFLLFRHDLDFIVACPGMDGEVRAISAFQTNEFAVFKPAADGVCTVTVSSARDLAGGRDVEYTLSSTQPLVTPPDSADPVFPTVDSAVSDGRYRLGDSVIVETGFFHPVEVGTGGGIPYILLDLASRVGYANYTAGSGNRTLTFEYVVEEGDSSANLGYTNRSALVVPDGSSITNALTGHGVAPVLPKPGDPGSLSAKSRIIVDGTPDTGAPSILSARTAGVRQIEVSFSEFVRAGTGGGSDWTLQGSDAAGISVTGKSVHADKPTTVLLETSADLPNAVSDLTITYAAPASGGITDTSANPLPDSGPLTVSDGIPPRIAAAAAFRNMITLEFSESVTVPRINTGEWAVIGTDSPPPVVQNDTAAANVREIKIGLLWGIFETDPALTLLYATDGGGIVDASSNALQNSVVLAADGIPPQVVDIITRSTRTIGIELSEYVKADSLAPSDFKVAGTNRVTAADLSGRFITLELEKDISAGESIKVEYDAAKIDDPASNPLDAFDLNVKNTLIGLTSVTSANVSGTFENGDRIVLEAVFPNPVSVSTPGIADGKRGFERLYGARHITETEIGGRHYALAASLTGVQIIDVTDPATAVAASFLEDLRGGLYYMQGPVHVETAEIDGRNYALVTSRADDSVSIVDITDPYRPTAVTTVRDGKDGFDMLEEPRSAAVAEIGGRHYAFVAAYGDSAVQIIDITEPANPEAVRSLVNGTDGFTMLAYPYSIAVSEINNRHYLFVASHAGAGIQIINVDAPSSPFAVATAVEGDGEFTKISRPHHISMAEISGRHYAIVSSLYYGSVQMIDVTTPADPDPTAFLLNGTGPDYVFSTTFESGGSHYAIVTSNDNSALQILDIDDTANPAVTATVLDDSGGFDELGGAGPISIVSIGGRIYAMVASFVDDAVQVIDVSDARNPSPVYPQVYLQLETGLTDRHASYTGGSGTRTLLFEYTVQGGDVSRLLSYAGTDALVVQKGAHIGERPAARTVVPALAEPGEPGSLSANRNMTIGNPPPNAAPELVSIGTKTIEEGKLFTFEASASDADGDPLRFALTLAPEGASITRNGNFTWTPTEQQDGVHNATVTVTDRFGATDSETFEITVLEVNAFPALSMIGDKRVGDLETITFTVDELKIFTFTATATDSDDGDAQEFGLADFPSGASITAGGLFTWTPGEHQDGIHNVTVTVTDGAGASDSETITVTVREVNAAPRLEAIEPMSINEYERISLHVMVDDPDNGDSHEFALTRPPDGAAIGVNTGIFEWTPGELQDGNHTVTVSVRDSAGAGDSTTFRVEVREINEAPVLDEIGDRHVKEGRTLSFTATATDADNNDRLTFEMTHAFNGSSFVPAGSSFAPAGGFTWTPTELQDGSYQVTVTVMDRAGESDFETFTVEVEEVNVGPELDRIGSRAIEEQKTLSFDASVTDPDNGDSHRFSLTLAPPGASITDDGTFSWTPTEQQDGVRGVNVTVTDRFGASDFEVFTVTVREVNVAPKLDRIADQSVGEQETLTFDVAVTDPDNNDVHTFSLPEPLRGTAIAQNGTFSWTPTEQQDGVHDITVAVRDKAGESDSEMFTVEVEEVNVGPELDPICGPPVEQGRTCGLSVRELEELEFTATVTDPDNGDGHTFSLEGEPTGAAINRTSGLFTWTPTELQDGEHTMTVTVRDDGGLSDSEAITVTVIEVDHVGPVPRVGTAEAGPTNSQRIVFWADFEEQVRPGSFGAGDIETSSGRATGPSSADGQNFTFAVTGAGEGSLTVSVPANGVQDIEGNWNEESNQVEILVDKTAPRPVLSTTAGSPTDAGRITFTATFDEPVDGDSIGAGDITASSGRVESLRLVGTDSFTFDIVGPATGTLRVGIPAGSVEDPAGNGNAASDTYEIVIDRNEPAPSVTALTASPTNAQVVEFRVDFDKDINPSSFTAGSVQQSSGTVSTPTEINSRRFTFSVSGPAEGDLTVSIPARRVQDTSGNYNIGSNTAAVVVDRTGPRPDISPVTASPTNARTVTFAVDFGEAIRAGSFGAGDVEVSDGRAASVRAAGENRFTFDVTGAGSGTLEVSIPAGRLQDVPGNGNADSDTARIVIDRDRPVPTITAQTQSPSNEREIEFRVDFDKEIDAVTFAAADISASSGEPSEPVSQGSQSFEFTVRNPAEGGLTVSIPAGRLQGTLGNDNAASNAASVTIDRTAPEPRITAATASPTNSQEIQFSVDFGEQIGTGTFGARGIAVSGGNVASGPNSTDDRSFEFTVSPSSDGIVAASVRDGAAQDLAGNPNTESNTASVLYDGKQPRITAAYLVSPGRVAVLYGELVDAGAVNGGGFSIQGRTVSSNTDPTLRSGVVTLRVTGAAGGDLLSYDSAEGSIADAAGNSAAGGSETIAEVADGTVTLPAGNPQRYELPPQISTVKVDRNGLPPEVVAPGRLSLDFSLAPTFSSDDPARTTVTLTDSASNLTSPAGGVAVTVSLPAGVSAESGSSWDGTFELPEPSGARPPASGQLTVHTKRVAFSLGTDTQILLDRAVRILVPGEGGQRVFVSEGGGASRSVSECGFADTQEAADAGLMAGEDCHTDVGRDLAIWTRHLSHWGTYHSGPRVAEPPPEPEPEQEATAEDAPTAAGGSGGGGGGGGAPEEIITDVRIYSVSWDCAAGAVVATVGPDTNQLTVRMRTSSVGERPVTEAASALLGSRTYTAAISGADQFAVVEANLAYEGDRTITKIVNLRECAGQVSIDRYEPPQQVAPRPEPEPRELCSDGREPALRDGSRLLCLFPGTFETLSERGWQLTRL